MLPRRKRPSRIANERDALKGAAANKRDLCSNLRWSDRTSSPAPCTIQDSSPML